MSKKDEIKAEIESLIFFHRKARSSFELYKYLYSNEVNDPFWVHIHHLSEMSFIIELDKVFSSSNQQKFNIRKLLNKLKSNGHYRSFNFDSNLISEWEKSIENNESLLKMINDSRSQVFAHSDRGEAKRLVRGHDIKAFEKLFNLIEEVISKLYSSIVGSTFSFHLDIKADRIQILKRLEEWKKLQTEKLVKELNDYKK